MAVPLLNLADIVNMAENNDRGSLQNPNQPKDQGINGSEIVAHNAEGENGQVNNYKFDSLICC